MIKGRRNMIYERQWPQVFRLLAGLLKTGMTLTESLDLILEESPEPLRKKMLRQVPADFSKWPVSQKINGLFPGPEFTLLRAALLLSYETGGGTSRLIEKAAGIWEKKWEIRQKIEVLTAQAKLTAWLASAAPFFLLAGLSVLAPDLMTPLFATRAGHSLLILVCLMIFAGAAVIHWMMKIEP